MVAPKVIYTLEFWSMYSKKTFGNGIEKHCFFKTIIQAVFVIYAVLENFRKPGFKMASINEL